MGKGREFPRTKFARNPRGSWVREQQSRPRAREGEGEREEAIHLILHGSSVSGERRREGGAEILFCRRGTAKLGAIRRDILAVGRKEGGKESIARGGEEEVPLEQLPHLRFSLFLGLRPAVHWIDRMNNRDSQLGNVWNFGQLVYKSAVQKPKHWLT